MVDWGLVANGCISGAAVLAAAVTWGRMEQRLADLAGRVSKVEVDVRALQNVETEVKILGQKVDSAAELNKTQRESDAQLTAMAIGGLQGEMRSFMQGMATGERRPRPAPKPKAH